MFMNDAVMVPRSAAQRACFWPELEPTRGCTFGGEHRPPVHELDRRVGGSVPGTRNSASARLSPTAAKLGDPLITAGQVTVCLGTPAAQYPGWDLNLGPVSRPRLEIEMATKRTYSQAQRRALLNADRERGHLRLTDSAGNRVHGMTLRALLRRGLIQRLWRPIPLTEFGAAEALRLHDAEGNGPRSQPVRVSAPGGRYEEGALGGGAWAHAVR